MKKINIANPLIGTSIQSLGISSQFILSIFSKQISKFANLVDVPIINLLSHSWQVNKFDYLYLSYCNPVYFILRQQRKINLPFIIHMHILNEQLIDFSTIIPFLHSEDIIIAPSQFVIDGIKKITYFDNIVKGNYLIDVKDIQNKIQFNDSFKNKISFLGRIIEPKGIESIINILPDLIKSNENISFEVIGPYSGERIDNHESDYFKKLKAKAQQLKVENAIKWYGSIANFVKYHILSSTDILINPSVYNGETFGVVNIEAFACGIPVISSDWKPFNEIIENGFNGFRVNVNYEQNSNSNKINENDLFNCINNLLNNKSLLAKMKRNAWEDAKQKYDLSNTNYELISLLHPKSSNKDYSVPNLLNKSMDDNKSLYTTKWIELVSRLDIYMTKFKNIIPNIPPNRLNNLSDIIISALKVIEDNKFIYSLDNVLVQDIMFLNKFLAERNDKFFLDQNMETEITKYIKELN